MSHVIEPATSGRARCRACMETIARGDLRLGERQPNPFGEGEATWWFHLRCGACKRPEAFLVALDHGFRHLDGLERDELEQLARRAIEHPRLVRFKRTEHDPSGRARCRHCRNTIAKESWRIALDVWEDGRFGSLGFIHLRCADAYFGTSQIEDHMRSQRPTPHRDDLLEIEQFLRRERKR